jgi:hypothetical protein
MNYRACACEYNGEKSAAAVPDILTNLSAYFKKAAPPVVGAGGAFASLLKSQKSGAVLSATLSAILSAILFLIYYLSVSVKMCCDFQLCLHFCLHNAVFLRQKSRPKKRAADRQIRYSVSCDFFFARVLSS